MHPNELKDKYGLSYPKLAVFLCKDQKTVSRYCLGTSPVPELVRGYCYLLDLYFQQNGVKMPPYIF